MGNQGMATVLVIDDDRDTRDMTVEVLRQAGIDADSCSSGTEALTLLESDTRIEAVMIDLAMPVLDGLTVAEEIRANERLHPEKRPVHLAFLTGYDIDEPIRRIAERTGVEQIILKDGNVAALPGKVRELLSP